MHKHNPNNALTLLGMFQLQLKPLYLFNPVILKFKFESSQVEYNELQELILPRACWGQIRVIYSFMLGLKLSLYASHALSVCFINEFIAFRRSISVIRAKIMVIENMGEKLVFMKLALHFILAENFVVSELPLLGLQRLMPPVMDITKLQEHARLMFLNRIKYLRFTSAQSAR